MTFDEQIHELEAQLISEALVNANGFVSHAAKSLGLHHWKLVLIMRRHPELQHLRVPPRTRRRSLLKPQWDREAL